MSRHRADTTALNVLTDLPPVESMSVRALPPKVGGILTGLSFAVVVLVALSAFTWGWLQHREAASAAAAADSASSRLSAAVASLSDSRAIVTSCRSRLSQARTAASATQRALAAAIPALSTAYETGDTATFQDTLASLKAAVPPGSC